MLLIVVNAGREASSARDKDLATVEVAVTGTMLTSMALSSDIDTETVTVAGARNPINARVEIWEAAEVSETQASDATSGLMGGKDDAGVLDAETTARDATMGLETTPDATVAVTAATFTMTGLETVADAGDPTETTVRVATKLIDEARS